MPHGAAPVIHIQQDEVLTGEAVVLDVQPVSYFQRALSCAIDVIASLLLLVVLDIIAGWFVGGDVLAALSSPVIAIGELALVLVIVPAFVESLSGGRSLGRWATGGRIVRADGGTSGLRQAFIRAMVGVLEIWLTAGALAALVGAFTPRSQRLGDLVAGTYCERVRMPRLADDAIELPAELTAWQTVADVARLPDRLARRVSQFVRQAPRLDPAARARVAADLAEEVSPFVSPLPPVAPETLLRGVVAARRDRELRALTLQNSRLALAMGTDLDAVADTSSR